MQVFRFFTITKFRVYIFEPAWVTIDPWQSRVKDDLTVLLLLGVSFMYALYSVWYSVHVAVSYCVPESLLKAGKIKRPRCCSWFIKGRSEITSNNKKAPVWCVFCTIVRPQGLYYSITYLPCNAVSFLYKYVSASVPLCWGNVQCTSHPTFCLYAF